MVKVALLLAACLAVSVSEAVLLCASSSASIPQSFCDLNCNHDPPFCPSSCFCTDSSVGDRPTIPTSSNPLLCESISSHVPDAWCNQECNHNPPYCPSSHCVCDGDVFSFVPTSPFPQDLSCVAIRPNATDAWCNDNCNHIPAFCPSTHCSCVPATIGPTPTPGPQQSYYSFCVQVTDGWCQATCSIAPDDQNCLKCCSTDEDVDDVNQYTSVCEDVEDEWCEAICSFSPLDQNCLACCIDSQASNTTSNFVPYFSVCTAIDDVYCTARCNHDPPDCITECCTSDADAAAAGLTPYFSVCTNVTDSFCTAVCNYIEGSCLDSCCTDDPNNATIPSNQNGTFVPYFSRCPQFTDLYCTSNCNANPPFCDFDCCDTSQDSPIRWNVSSADECGNYTESYCTALCTLDDRAFACGVCCNLVPDDKELVDITPLFDETLACSSTRSLSVAEYALSAVELQVQQSGFHVIDTCGSSFDTSLRILGPDFGVLHVCDNQDSCANGIPGHCSSPTDSALRIWLDPAQGPFYAVVDGAAKGAYDISLNCQ